MPDLDGVNNLGFRGAIDATHLRSLQVEAEKEEELEKILFRTNKEIAGLEGEHDGFMGGVDPLIAKRDRRLAHPFPRVPQIVREILCEIRLGRCPAVVRL